MSVNDNEKIMAVLIRRTAEAMALKKAVLSKPSGNDLKKSIMTPVKLGDGYFLKVEGFYSDNKARQENIPFCNVEKIEEYVRRFSQVNVISSVGECQYVKSKSGNSTLIGIKKLEGELERIERGSGEYTRILPGANNREKTRILSGDEEFLILLGVSDKNGRVYDKKQAKFRQINRFLELIRDCENALPSEGTLRICDLCCGKSYLSFAVYYYFTKIKKRDVIMTGIDLKEDVIMYCSDVAKKLKFDSLEFRWGDIKLYDPCCHVDLVISLHACDTATDIVIDKALEWGAQAILSTPCCHHEMNRILDCQSLSFISRYSMLKQKLCDAATDSLRLLLLEAHGYSTAALELIDPDETPKNIMLRGIRKKNFDKNSEYARQKQTEYLEAYEFLTGKKSDRFSD